MSFIDLLKNEEFDYSINGATMFKTSTSNLVDLNFNVSSLRHTNNRELWSDFYKALEENSIYALKWLLYLRDIRYGIGERNTFVRILKNLCIQTDINSKDIMNLHLEDFGRWKDLIDLFILLDEDTSISNDKKEEVEYSIILTLAKQLVQDISNLEKHKNISLLAKWMPAVKHNKRNYKEKLNLIKSLGFKNEKDYRNYIKPLKKHLKLVEQYASANKWNKIEYENVPSLASLKYQNAFLRHDKERREQYLEDVKQGHSKMNVNTIFPYQIISKYDNVNSISDELEVMWNNLKKVKDFNNTLIVRDGSGSMYANIPNTKGKIKDIADSLTLYCSQNNNGYFKDKFITFSSKPQIVDLSNSSTLFDKIRVLESYDDYSNTNIEAVFNLILKTAKKNKLSQEELPKQVLIISDMGFDEALETDCRDKTLFDNIRDTFKENGYELPKLIFWNVDAYNDAKIPMQENSNGLILLSGFSINLLNMVCSSEINPKKALFETLSSDRYSIVDKIFPDINLLNKQLKLNIK